MNNTDHIRMFLSMFAMNIPTLLVCLVGCVAVIGNWKRLSSAAIWAALGFGVALLLCFLVPLGQTAAQAWIRQGGEVGSRASIYSSLSLLWSLLRAATYVFLLLAVIMGRSRPATMNQ